MDAFNTFAFEDIVRYAIAFVVLFGSLAAIGYTIWGAFLIILSGGNEEKVKGAVNHIRHALIGVVFIMCVLFIVPVFMKLVGLPYGEYAKPAAIFQTISQISAKFFGASDSSFENVPTSGSLPADFSDL